MGKIYKNQIGLKINLDLQDDITGETTTVIKYIKPDGVAGSWAATVDSLTSGLISYVTVSGDLDVVGDWIIWGHTTFTAGNVYAGEPEKRYVHEEGQ